MSRKLLRAKLHQIIIHHYVIAASLNISPHTVTNVNLTLKHVASTILHLSAQNNA